MEYPVINICTRAQRRKLLGREHLVAPMVLLVEGVLNGSKGPLYYPRAAICQSADSWNHMPITVDHPHRAGVSARDPDILEQQGVGTVLNARCEGSRLVADGWFDVNAVRRVYPPLLRALESGEKIELSTGLFTDNSPSRGSYRGRPYSHIALNYRPDHLAILVDQVGACSLKDGCGVYATNSRSFRYTSLDVDDDPPLLVPTIDFAKEYAARTAPRQEQEHQEPPRDPDYLPLPPRMTFPNPLRQ